MHELEWIDRESNPVLKVKSQLLRQQSFRSKTPTVPKSNPEGRGVVRRVMTPCGLPRLRGRTLRMVWDSNPRHLSVNSLSRRAQSASLSTIQISVGALNPEHGPHPLAS